METIHFISISARQKVPNNFCRIVERMVWRLEKQIRQKLFIWRHVPLCWETQYNSVHSEEKEWKFKAFNKQAESAVGPSEVARRYSSPILLSGSRVCWSLSALLSQIHSLTSGKTTMGSIPIIFGPTVMEGTVYRYIRLFHACGQRNAANYKW